MGGGEKIDVEVRKGWRPCEKSLSQRKRAILLLLDCVIRSLRHAEARATTVNCPMSGGDPLFTRPRIPRYRPGLLWRVEPPRLQEQTAAGCLPVRGPQQRNVDRRAASVPTPCSHQPHSLRQPPPSPCFLRPLVLQAYAFSSISSHG